MPLSQIELSPNTLQVSRIAVGCMNLPHWQMSSAELAHHIEQCLNLGFTTFDHADIYGDYTSEERFGKALALNPGLRSKMQLATKCGIKLVSEKRPEHELKHYDTSPAHIMASVDRSLRNLQTDTLDLLLLHRPDPLQNPDEIAEAFTRLRQQGKVRFFGVSNYSTTQFELLASRLDFPLVTNQVECSLLHRQPLFDGILDLCQRRRIAPMVWGPLAGGRLFAADQPDVRPLQAVLKEIAAQVNVRIDQVALAWLLRHPANLIPVLGTGKLDRLKRAAEAVDLKLCREQWFALLRAARGHDVA